MESILLVFVIGVSVAVPYYLFAVLVRWPWLIIREAAGMPASGTSPATRAEEKTGFNVILANAGNNRIEAIKAVRTVTGLGLNEAKGIVERVPTAIKEGVPKAEARDIKAKIEAIGGIVEIRSSTSRRAGVLRSCLVIGQFAIALAVFFGAPLFSSELFAFSKNMFLAAGIGTLAGGIVNCYLTPQLFGRLLIDPPRVFLEITSERSLMTKSEVDEAQREFRQMVSEGSWAVVLVHVPISIAVAITASSHFYGLALLAFSLSVRMRYRVGRSK